MRLRQWALPPSKAMACTVQNSVARARPRWRHGERRGPSFIVSYMTAATTHCLGRSFEEHHRRVAATLPVRWVGRPEDIAHTVSYLTSGGAGYVTGQVLYAAGAPAG